MFGRLLPFQSGGESDGFFLPKSDEGKAWDGIMERFCDELKNYIIGGGFKHCLFSIPIWGRFPI